MKGVLVLAAALLTAAAFGQGWLLKAPYAANAKTIWKVSVKATIGGVDHEVRFNHTLTIASKSEAEIKGKGSWTEFVFDGNVDPDQDATWEISLKPDGSIISAGKSGDYVKMLAPVLFVYPNKEVKPGDKWTAKFKASPTDKEVAVNYEVAELVKVGEVDALKVTAKFSGEGPFKGGGAYWLSKDGVLLKYELDLKSWTVPLAGQSDFDAKVVGEIAKTP